MVRTIGAQDGMSLDFSCSDIEFAGELMEMMAETAVRPIAFVVSFAKDEERQKSRFINPKGEQGNV